ncbi:hypothetical protein UFOVP698_33 [uncultured Caudovirales phage]|uniref:Uncharacterized protein n=1 Tax=uncultured Caudovirales phage TaxID=2100421 RepID=A0A6J5NNR3_9CAUD|nr:hypothetical protein UFOVP698_33 [uncultured Caudovirales phage]
MAEQSIGMATGVGVAYGDGNGTGYASSRMTAMETKTLSDGVLQVGGLLAMTGNGTATLTIADGAAVVGGYFYENTSSAAIVISTLANATYTVAILVNSTAGSLTVSRSVAGTTIGTYSVRVVVATAAQLSGLTYVTLGTVTVTGAVLSAITPAYTMYGTTTQLPYQSYVTMTGGTATLTTASTAYDVASYSSSSTTSEAIFSAVNSTGIVTVRRAGLYMITSHLVFGTASTGARSSILKVNGTSTQRNMMTPGAATSYSASTWMVVLAANDTVNIAANTLTTAAQSVTDSLFTITRA